MTEAEWLACDDPQRMLNHLGVDDDWTRRGWLRRWLRPPPRVSRRKLLLFVSGCVAWVASLVKGADAQRRRWQHLAATLEQHANGQATAADVARVRSAVGWEKDDPNWIERLVGVPGLDGWDVDDDPPALACPYAAALLYAGHLGYREQGAEALRELVGDPFLPSRLDPLWLGWDDRVVPKLAQAIYDDRAVDRLPILADALEEAGCTDEAILTHLRSPGPHVRGCWALDLVLGKS